MTAPLHGKFGLVALGIGVVLTPLVSSLLAQSSPATNQVEQLPTTIVTATAIPDEPLALPYSVSAVTSQELEQRLLRTTVEALRYQPAVMLQKTSYGMGSPYLRGFTGFRTLMLIDGIRLNNSTFRDGPNQYWNTIDSMSLDRLEMVRGPSSVLYGSDAIGGTVNALTLGRKDYQTGFDWDGRALYRFSSAEDSHVVRGELSASQGDKLGVHVGGSWKEFGDLLGGSEMGRQPQTGYRERDYDLKADYFFKPNLKLTYAHQTVNMDDAWRTHSTIYGVVWSGSTRGTDLTRIFDQNRDLDYLQFHATELEGAVQELHFSLSHHLQTEVEDRIRANLNREVQGNDVRTLGASLQLHSPSPVGRLVYGVEYYHDWVTSHFRRYNAAGAMILERAQGPVADDATYDLLGVYVEDHLPILGEKLELTLGGRYTYAGLEAGKVVDPLTGGVFSMSDAWNNLVGNARLLYRVDQDEHWSLFGGVSQGFRAPNLSDLTRFDIARTKEQEVPAYGLKPERFLSFEGGVKTKYRRFAAEAAFFHTMIDDMIVRLPTGVFTLAGDQIVNKANSGKGYVQGVELGGSVQPVDQWTLWGNFTWMEGYLDTPTVAGGAMMTEPLTRMMPVTLNLGLRWEHPNKKFWAECVSTFAATQDRLSSGDLRDTERIPAGGTPGYDVYSLRAGWRPCKNATLTAALENLADTDYRIHGSGVNEPGRGVVVSLDIRF